MKSVHHVTDGVDFPAGLVWPKDKFRHFTVSLLALHDITAINLPVPLDKSNSFHSMAIHLLVYSSTVLFSSLLPKTIVATVGTGGHSWNVLVNVQLTM